ncbi:hypothetical protein CEXT_669601 [Caerostris extrusa]|uniref:Uncharacterized protein n=1 Tax=Caerostris extrusa TaxID=172846 RepID=A0AAV4XXJ2_CAEEX|nr:hypothetical protein CEXT_669601 [Caerostris extrusa]
MTQRPEAIHQLMNDVAQQPHPKNDHNPRLSHRAHVLPEQTLALRPHTWVALLINQKVTSSRHKMICVSICECIKLKKKEKQCQGLNKVVIAPLNEHFVLISGDKAERL